MTYSSIIDLKSNNQYSLNEYCKILCLTEALLLIKEKDSQFNNYKRCSIKHYIDSRSDEVQRDLIMKWENKNSTITSKLKLI